MALAKGVWVYESPENPLAEQAKKDWREEKLRLRTERAERRERPVPNRICYAETAFKDWKPGMPLPHCDRCTATLQPNENHDCPVKNGTEEFRKKYVEHTPERRERWEAKREEIRESRRAGVGVFCSECNQLLDCQDDAEWHFEDHGGKPERGHYAIDGEPDGDKDGYDDDLSGYEDEPEDDWCDEDEDEGD
jgi:hypothetical protein